MILDLQYLVSVIEHGYGSRWLIWSPKRIRVCNNHLCNQFRFLLMLKPAFTESVDNQFQ